MCRKDTRLPAAATTSKSQWVSRLYTAQLFGLFEITVYIICVAQNISTIVWLLIDSTLALPPYSSLSVQLSVLIDD